MAVKRSEVFMSIEIIISMIGSWAIWFTYPWGDMDFVDRYLPIGAKDRDTNSDCPVWDDLGILLARS